MNLEIFCNFPIFKRNHDICVICRYVFPTATCCSSSCDSSSNSTSSYTNNNNNSSSSSSSRSRSKRRRSRSRNSDCDCDCDCDSDSDTDSASATSTTFPTSFSCQHEHVANVGRTCCSNISSSSSSSSSCCCCSRWCRASMSSNDSTNDNNQKLTTANCNCKNNNNNNDNNNNNNNNNINKKHVRNKHEIEKSSNNDDFIYPILQTCQGKLQALKKLLQQQQQQSNQQHKRQQQQQARRQHPKHYQHSALTQSIAFTIIALLTLQATTAFAWQTATLHAQQEQEQQQQHQQQQQQYEESRRFANSLATLTRGTRSADASNNAISRGNNIDGSGGGRGSSSDNSGGAKLATNIMPCKSMDIRNNISDLNKLENCTVIEGFVLITLIHDAANLTRTYPRLIEVTGYVIVFRVPNLTSLNKIFPNLAVIRGNILFESYALVIYQNPQLSEVGLSNLRAIVKGGVRIEKNTFLCFAETVNWKRILSPNATDAEIMIKYNRDGNECPRCPGDTKIKSQDGRLTHTDVAQCTPYDGKRFCWNSTVCQTICPKECPYSCIDENTCCNKSCLGSCTNPEQGVSQCLACHNASNRDGKCVESCKKDEYQFEQRCVTANECLAMGNKYENSEEMPLLVFNGKCTTRCDPGYFPNNNTCEKCQGICVKKCKGEVIDSVERIKNFHGCTHIVEKGLQITIKRGGQHLIDALISGFGMVETIETFLQVHSTYGIVTLDFFKRLKTIKGDIKIDDRYSLYVLENRDLEHIWGENQTVQIEKGSIFFHFNPKLCFETIEQLKPMLPDKPTTLNKNEVAEDSNGNKGTCNTRWMSANVTDSSPESVDIEINSTIVDFNDERAFIGYVIHHTLDPYENTTKDNDQPCSDKWIISDPIKGNKTKLNQLRPYTKYALYVRTMTISSEKRNYQSDIVRFQTKPAQPDPVTDTIANSTHSTEILLKWSPPLRANGVLSHYQIRAQISSRDPLLEVNRNYCRDPLPNAPIKDKPSSPEEKVVSEKVKKEGCSCDAVGRNIFDQQSTERKIGEETEFENALQNFLYVPRKKKKIINTNNNTINTAAAAVRSDNAVVQGGRSKRYIEIGADEPKESVLMRTVGSVPPTQTDKNNKTYLNTLKHLNWKKEIKMDPTNTYYTVFSAEVNASTTEFLFTKLRHFSLYTLTVHACRKQMGPNDNVLLCSSFESWDKRTVKKPDADRIKPPVTRLERTQNMTRDSVRLTWDPPENPNGAVVGYTIFYERAETNSVKEPRCISVEEYRNKSGYVAHNLKEGSYSFTVRVNTLAGEGEISETVTRVVPPPGKTWTEIMIWVGGIVLICIILGLLVFTYIRTTKKHPQDLVMNTEVNPFYASLQYVPDDWEVPRERIIQLGPLGQGSFGMVYEGILKAQNSQGEDTPCAIKTVNENATDRERTNFLSEASVMKQFDTYHVVHLLGVCSCGQPALVVMELMKKGDLKSYLRAHRPDEREAVTALQQRIGITSMAQPPPYSRIFQMAIEIADGMAYLAYKKFVHRDLAARNCMVAEDLTVKIGDFGMTRDIYETDYYRKGTKGLLPVRWMPPESLRDGVYSSSSDVFSYGVVLWEMATLASQPYQGLSNEQVLRFVIDGGIMERPDNCPEVMHRLMHRCWHHRPSARPSFLDIIAYLENLAEPKFKEVAFYYSDTGVQHREKERKENSNQMEIFAGGQLDADVDGEDATTPLRVGEYQGYKSNMDHNTSMDQPAESPIAMVDDQATTHSPFSIPSGFMVSSTPDALSTLPTAGGSHMEDAAYVMPDGHAGTHPEQGYEIYDPSPNFAELPHSGGSGGMGGRLSGEQHLLPKKKRGGNVANMSSSMPDEMIDGGRNVVGGHVAGASHAAGPAGGASSSLQPSTGSSSNASNSRHPSLKRVVAETLRNRVGYGILSRFNHKRSGSNVSHKSNVSNAPSSSSNSNLTSHPAGMAMVSMGTNLGTIESGGSGSAGSYAGTPHFYTPTATTPSAGGGNGSTTIVSDNPNYKLLDESINSTGDPVPYSGLNPNYALMQPPLGGDQHRSNSPSYLLMSDPNLTEQGVGVGGGDSGGHIFTTDNPNYAPMMAPIAVNNSDDDDNDDDNDDDDDADEITEHIKMERMPLSRQKPRARIKPMQQQQQQHHHHYQPRSRSVSQSRKAEATTPTPTLTPTATTGGTGGNTSNILKENWLRQVSSTPRPPPPNGFIGREA